MGIPDRPVALDIEQDLATAVVVRELGLEEVGQVLYEIDLGLLDVLHAAVDVLAGLFVFDLLGAELFFHSEVFFLGFLHLRQGGVVSESALLELLPGCLFGVNLYYCPIARHIVPGTPSSGQETAPSLPARSMWHYQHRSPGRGRAAHSLFRVLSDVRGNIYAGLADGRRQTYKTGSFRTLSRAQSPRCVLPWRNQGVRQGVTFPCHRPRRASSST